MSKGLVNIYIDIIAAGELFVDPDWWRAFEALLSKLERQPISKPEGSPG